VKKKRVPTSSTLTKSISPPMHSTMDLVMTKPKPVPFSFAARCSAGWQNGTNNACCFAAGMPTPLSRTSKVTRELLGVKACAKSAKSALSSSSLHALPPEIRIRGRKGRAREFRCFGVAGDVRHRHDEFHERVAPDHARAVLHGVVHQVDAALP